MPPNKTSTSVKESAIGEKDHVSGTPPAKRSRTLAAPFDESLPRLDKIPDALHFFQNHVATRQPCIVTTPGTNAAIITNGGNNNNNNKTPIKPWPSLTELQGILGDCPIQVEQRPSTQQTFGQGRAAEFLTNMTFSDFVQQPKDKRHLLYLSTQAASSNSDDEKEDDRYAQYSCLTQRLVAQGYIPPHLDQLAGNLQLSSCHLWMGGGQGSCSGLHHDFHDNFYWIQAGRKRLYLYPPNSPIPVHGQIEKVHAVNGLISYVSRPTRADGVPWALLRESENTVGENENDDDDDEDEVVIGKGFDYQSDDEENNDIDSSRDDFEELGEEEQDTDEVDFGKDVDAVADEEQKPAATRPPDHFSPVNLDSPTLYEDYPVMRECEPIIVELTAGDILYLPASWFHCVWSFADTDDFHIAVNYWYHVPDQLGSCENPYKDDFWKKQMATKS